MLRVRTVHVGDWTFEFRHSERGLHLSIPTQGRFGTDPADAAQDAFVRAEVEQIRGVASEYVCYWHLDIPMLDRAALEAKIPGADQAITAVLDAPRE